MCADYYLAKEWPRERRNLVEKKQNQCHHRLSTEANIRLRRIDQHGTPLVSTQTGWEAVQEDDIIFGPVQYELNYSLNKKGRWNASELLRNISEIPRRGGESVSALELFRSPNQPLETHVEHTSQGRAVAYHEMDSAGKESHRHAKKTTAQTLTLAKKPMSVKQRSILGGTDESDELPTINENGGVRYELIRQHPSAKVWAKENAHQQYSWVASGGSARRWAKSKQPPMAVEGVDYDRYELAHGGHMPSPPAPINTVVAKTTIEMSANESANEMTVSLLDCLKPAKGKLLKKAAKCKAKDKKVDDVNAAVKIDAALARLDPIEDAVVPTTQPEDDIDVSDWELLDDYNLDGYVMK